MAVKRFGVSLEEDVLVDLDKYTEENKYPNRSQAIRSLIEKHMVEEKWKCNNKVAGAIVLVYDHHKHDINQKNIDLQHQYHHLILSTQHVHLDHELCLETIAVQGVAKEITALSEALIAMKGVMHGKLVMSRSA